MTKEMQTQLRVLAAETRPTACLGCGFEYNCSLNGCAVLNAALQDAENSEVLKKQYCSEIVRLKEENRSIRENSVSLEVYRQALEEREAAVDCLNRMYRCGGEYCDRMIDEWRGLQKEDGDCDL